MNRDVRSRTESEILVVDDSAAIRKILQRVLRQTGMSIRDFDRRDETPRGQDVRAGRARLRDQAFSPGGSAGGIGTDLGGPA